MGGGRIVVMLGSYVAKAGKGCALEPGDAAINVMYSLFRPAPVAQQQMARQRPGARPAAGGHGYAARETSGHRYIAPVSRQVYTIKQEIEACRRTAHCGLYATIIIMGE